jgi:serine/threonine protein kinase
VASRWLVIEDDEALRCALADTLSLRGLDVVTCTTVAEAYAALEERADGIIVDVQLPDGQAEDVVLHATRSRPWPAIIVMSGSASPEDAFRLAQLGVRTYLPKPIRMPDLERAIDAALGPRAGAPHVRGLGAYDVVGVLGAGGMGTVYEARHRVLGRSAAIKVLHPHLASQPRAVARFVAEGRAASRVHHAAVVEIVDVGEEAGLPFLVMDFLQGEDLARRIARSIRLAPADAVALLLPVLAGLGAAHAAGVIHRDLKPSNVILTARGPVLVDFGISRIAGEDAGLTGSDTTLGTVHYMAPEQSEAPSLADARSDLYSFGVMLYECLAGVRPFRGDSVTEVLLRAAKGGPEPLRRHVPDVPAALEAVVLRSFARAPADRYPSASELAAALAPFGATRSR